MIESQPLGKGLLILLKEMFSFSTAELESYFQKIFGDDGINVTSPSEGEYLVSWNGMQFKLNFTNEPIPADFFKVALLTSYGLKDGESLVDGHRAYIKVTPLSEATKIAAVVMRSIMVMKLAFSLKSGEVPLGYYWESSQTLKDYFGFEKSLASINHAMELQAKNDPAAGAHLPLSFWAGIRFFKSRDFEGVRAITIGTREIAGYELEYSDEAISQAEKAEVLLSMLAYLVSSGAQLKDGDTVGVSPKREFTLSYKKADDKLPRRYALVAKK